MASKDRNSNPKLTGGQVSLKVIGNFTNQQITSDLL